MASEYLMKKYKDVKPEAPKEMTPKQKRVNWWHYHRIQILIVIIVVIVLASSVWEVVSKVEPDYQIAFFSDQPLLEGELLAIQDALAAIADDRNDDGRIVVQVNNYSTYEGDPYGYTTQVSLMGDISVGMSDFFLLDDPISFQMNYGALAMSDGSEFDDGMDPELCIRAKLSEIPLLSGLELSRELYLAQGALFEDGDAEKYAEAVQFWNVITEGMTE